MEPRDPDTWHVSITGGDGPTAAGDHVSVMEESHAVNVGSVRVQALVTQTQCHAELLTVTRNVTRHATCAVDISDTRALNSLLYDLKIVINMES